MGYDPFWPISLATVNVLVVPANPISPTQFEECIQALRRVSSVDSRDVDLSDINSDLLFPTKSQKGTILLNYSTNHQHSSIQRFPLELNAEPQIVLGIYAAEIGEDERDGSPDRYEVVLTALGSKFANLQNGCMPVLMCVDHKTHKTSKLIFSLSGLDEEAVYTALTSVVGHFIKNAVRLTSALTEIQLQDPHALHDLNGAGDSSRVPEVDGPSRQDRTNGQSVTADMSSASIQVRL
jgi:hypothetical protein